MLERIRRGMEDGEKGFTLIELMVVFAIIGVLITISVPAFLGAQAKAQSRAPQSSLGNALVSARMCYSDHDSYNDGLTAWCDGANLQSLEPSIRFNDEATPSGDANTVSVLADSQDVWFGAALSASDVCYFIKDDIAAGADGTTFFKAAGECSGNNAKLLDENGNYTKTGWQ
jgi:type IV pilus assembly protein PilA